MTSGPIDTHMARSGRWELPRFADLSAARESGASAAVLRFPKLVWPVRTEPSRLQTLLLLDVPRAGSWRGVPGLLIEHRDWQRKVRHVVVHPCDGLPHRISDHGRSVNRPLLGYTRELARSLVAWAHASDKRVGGRRSEALEEDARHHAEAAAMDWLTQWGWPVGIDLRQVMATIPLDGADLVRRRATAYGGALKSLGRATVPFLVLSQQPGLYGLSRLLQGDRPLTATLAALIEAPVAAAGRLLASFSVAANSCVAVDRRALHRLAMLHHLAPRSPLHAHDAHLGAVVQRFDRELRAFRGASIWQWIQALQVRRYGLNGAVSRCMTLSNASDPTARRIWCWLQYLRDQLATAGLDGLALEVALAGWLSESDVVVSSDQFKAAVESPSLDLRRFRASSVVNGDFTVSSIRVRPILTVEALIEEGMMMRHCVGRLDHQHALLAGRSLYFALCELGSGRRATLRIASDRSFFGHYELTGEGNVSLDHSCFSAVVPELQRLIRRKRMSLGSQPYRKARWGFGVLPLPRQGSLVSQLHWAEKQAIKLRAADFFAAIIRFKRHSRRAETG